MSVIVFEKTVNIFTHIGIWAQFGVQLTCSFFVLKNVL